MNFFKELKEIIGDKTVTISITADGERLVVVSLPKAKNDEPLTGFVPLCMTGTPDQLEAGFMNSLAKSVEVLNGLKSNLDAVEKSKVETSAKTTTTTSKKGKGKKEEKQAEEAETPSGDEGLPFSDSTEEDPDDVFSDVKPTDSPANSASESKPNPSPVPAAKPAPAAAPAAQQATIPMDTKEQQSNQPVNESSDEW